MAKETVSYYNGILITHGILNIVSMRKIFIKGLDNVRRDTDVFMLLKTFDASKLSYAGQILQIKTKMDHMLSLISDVTPMQEEKEGKGNFDTNQCTASNNQPFLDHGSLSYLKTPFLTMNQNDHFPRSR